MDKRRVFLDANILLDFLNKSRENHKIACELLYFLESNDFEIVISEDVITNIFYIEKDKKLVVNFLNDILLNGWIVQPFGKDIIKNAISLCLEKSIDLEDLLQCLCAKKIVVKYS